MKLSRLAALGIPAVLAWPTTVAFAQTGSLSGRVFVAAGGKPVAAAEVLLTGLKLSTRSDSAGEYRLGMIPSGTHEVTVRSIGYQSLSTRIEFTPDKEIRAHFQMTSTGSVLDTVAVKGTLEPRWAQRLVEFDQRRQTSSGVFLTHDKIAKNSSMSISNLLRSNIPGLRIVKIGGADVASSSRGGRNCPMQVLLNRMNMYNGESVYFDVSSIQADQLLGVEYYNAFNTPPEMSGRPRGPYGGSRCGTMVLWMK